MNDHLTFAQLCQLLDDEAVAAGAIAHAQSCTRCADRLASLRSQAEAMRMLAAREGITPHRGSILGAAREAGLDCLCRLLRELACACARLDPELAEQAAQLQAARPVESVAPDVHTMARRLSGLGLIIDLNGLPERSLSPAQAGSVAEHVLTLLGRLEPPARTRTLRDALKQHALKQRDRQQHYQPTAAPSLRDSLAPR
ncbi:MAG: hypothetical protein DRQ55_06270 [Planctomycetota bacterium]|nr:MAG: hypothetical protein DRQ55_06270 [Planctomycetota bacterium]